MPINLAKQLHESALALGADYFGVADLTPAQDVIFEQGGTEIGAYPDSVSIGIHRCGGGFFDSSHKRFDTARTVDRYARGGKRIERSNGYLSDCQPHWGDPGDR